MILNYVHDPMCSWCWAYRPVLKQLRSALNDAIGWRNLLGGLAPDSDEPMPEPVRKMVQGHWRKIEQELGTEFNHDFWRLCQPRRSTSIACRAVLAATEQGREEAMILAIQKAYYLQARNPSDLEVLVQLADELLMDSAAFRLSLVSPETEHELQKQIRQARIWPVNGFPSLVLQSGSELQALPLDYRNVQTTLSAINHLIS